MDISETLDKITSINWFMLIKLNFFSHHIRRAKGAYIIPYRNSVIQLDKNSIIELNSNLHVNAHKIKGSKAEAYLKLKKGAKLQVNGTIYMMYATTIEIHENAEIVAGSFSINCGAVIIAAKKITIGKEVLISRNVFIYDSDHHAMLTEDGERSNPAKEVVIGDHVWVGIKSTILRGVKIGNGAVIAADSLVIGKIKPNVLASGSPARAFMEVNWKV